MALQRDFISNASILMKGMPAYQRRQPVNRPRYATDDVQS